MNDELRNTLQNATQNARQLLEKELSEQLEGIYDILPDGRIPEEPGSHLDAGGRVLRRKLVTAIEHKQASGMKPAEAVQAFLREAAFTTLNRFVALKMLEARGLVQECVSSVEESKGFREFSMLAPGLAELPDGGYRLYIESLFDEIGQEVQVLFDRRDVAGMLWPRRQALHDLLDLLNDDELAPAWQDEEAIGWVYQYFNSKEERREMRSESSAPRNSYELAVRNQFFTPDYVVRFLVDNTLGRTWYEMRQGDTRLTDELDYFARREGEIFLQEDETPPQEADEGELYVPFRARKDPRDLKVLDPACGSGHFLLYAFDVLETIYEEAWQDDALPASEATGTRLRDDYATEEELRRAVPGLILAHNLYGVDIDERAAQIAGLALWMRAQQAYEAAGVPRAERPGIRKTNVVTAEPMPGEEELREEFVASLEPAALRPLVEQVFEQMKLAGETGMLLRIEEVIREAVKEARLERSAPDLFTAEERTDEAFWQTAEERVYEALAAYAEQGAADEQLRRRLFAEDATRGFAFIDLCRQPYDVVLMNPPFGEPAKQTKKYLEDAYTDTKNDILQAFVERADELLVPAGFLGAITSRTPFFLSSAQAWRERVVLRRFRPQVLADFGMGVLDAMVETAAYTMRTLTKEEDRALTYSLLPDLLKAETSKKGAFSVPKYMAARSNDGLKRHQAERELERLMDGGFIVDVSGRYPQYERDAARIKRAQARPPKPTPQADLLCVRCTDDQDKNAILHAALQDRHHEQRFTANPDAFADVPGAPFAYWVSDNVRVLFRDLSPFEHNGRRAQHGLSTKDDFRYLRCWWEVPAQEACPPEVHPRVWQGRYCVSGYKWFLFAKGGSYSPLYGDLHLVVNWKNSGYELEADLLQKYPYLNGDADWVLHRECDYFRPGLTWTPRTAKGFNIRALPKGALFASKGPAAFAQTAILAWNALLNSEAWKGLMDLHMAVGSFEVGVIARTPVPQDVDLAPELEELALRAVESKGDTHSANELNHGFVATSGASAAEGLRGALGRQRRSVASNADLQAEVQEEIDELAYQLYGIDERDRKNIRRALGKTLNESSDEDEEAELPGLEEEVFAHDLVSYFLGAVSGRWDLRFATREKEHSPQPDPFAPLPVCPPGMLQDEATGLPLDTPPAGYPIRFPEDGVLVDDPGHERDVIRRIREVLGLIYDDPAAIEAEAVELLGESDLRSYFRKATGFFQEHRKQYSKSRRKAPIYWPLTTASGGYTVWLYYPRLTRDTFYRVLDVVKDKVHHEEGVLRDLKQEAGPEPSATQRKEIADQEDFVAELRQFQQEVERIAPLWQPDLNDGVIINFAPLHRLASLNRSWQKDLEKTWKKLVDGEYDWSHWAMHLWPERVVPQCAERRDLAIAHGLEDVFWKKNAEGDWEAREEPTRSIEELIEERTSPTVKAALESLLEAR